MEIVTNHFEAWIAEQTAKEQQRINPILTQARGLVDRVITERGVKRESFVANVDIVGYSYSVQIPDIFDFLTPETQDLFETVWSVAGNPLVTPDFLVCHLVRQNASIPTMGEGPEYIQESQAHVITFIFNAGQYGLVQATTRDNIAKIKLDPDSLWRPYTIGENKVKSYQKELDQSRETSARLALLLAGEATKPQILSRSQRFQVN